MNGKSMMARMSVLSYGVICYAIFFATFLYAFGFVGNLFVPKSMDSPADGPLWQALLINLGLLAVFAVQHSVMARPAFKRWWTQYVRRPVERSTYVLFSSLALILLFWQWRPMGGVVWHMESQTARMIMHGIFVSGWMLVLVATFLINHFDLFGLRQVWLYFRGRKYTYLPFRTPGPYQHVRHPLYVGWLLAFWATPTMTVAHLLFAIMTAAYILMAIRWEERDLATHHGRIYTEYRERVPMLVPSLKGVKMPETTVAQTVDA
ncbi:isoprenylcysteine carboxylmethyltransferase family protein [bacterium]|nr:isoprenylcysteine carboxylmethyltransferase family protein [bacterium]